MDERSGHLYEKWPTGEFCYIHQEHPNSTHAARLYGCGDTEAHYTDRDEGTDEASLRKEKSRPDRAHVEILEVDPEISTALLAS